MRLPGVYCGAFAEAAALLDGKFRVFAIEFAEREFKAEAPRAQGSRGHTRRPECGGNCAL